MKLPGKTVFVVGAGGSVPHSFPSGQQLLDEFVARWHDTSSNSTTILDRLGLEEYKPRLRELARLANRMAASSLDECVRHHPACGDAAKIAIAQRLLTQERATVQARFRRVEGDWLGYLIRAILRDRTHSLSDVSFITFNFDRLIEWRLAEIVSARNGWDAVHSLAPNMSVIHMNGSFGPTVWTTGQTDAVGSESPAVEVPFGCEVTGQVVGEAINRLQFVHELRAAEAQHAAKREIEAATVVCFLGFGFADENIQALGIEREPSIRKIYVASGHGMTKAEAREVELRFPHRLRVYEEHDALSMLRSVPVLHGDEVAPAYGSWI